jgi:hypothetical protein
MSAYYIIESSGEPRQRGGPTPARPPAKNAAGGRHTVIEGDGLLAGQTISRGMLQRAIQSGRISVADGSDSRALAGC